VAQLIEALRYKPERRAFNSRWCHWSFFIDIILPTALMALGLTHSLTHTHTHTHIYIYIYIYIYIIYALLNEGDKF